MKQRFVGLAAALALCCTVSGAMLERAVCCPAPPGLAHIEKQFQTMVGMEKRGRKLALQLSDAFRSEICGMCHSGAHRRLWQA